jgi:hypothetical protein
MSHWHDTMVDRSEAGATYVTGWTISGLAVLTVIFTASVFAIWRRRRKDSRAGSLHSSLLGGVERKGLPIGT